MAICNKVLVDHAMIISLILQLCMLILLTSQFSRRLFASFLCLVKITGKLLHVTKRY